MEYIAAKLLLPIFLPMLLGMIRMVIDRWTPIALEKLPSGMWPALAAVLAQTATVVSPDLFVFEGIPSWASTAFYSVAAVGAREFMDQFAKTTGLRASTPTSPIGM